MRLSAQRDGRKVHQGKTQLSRSGVMRILADLKTGGFIEMEEGRLIKINKLPPNTEFQTQKRPQRGLFFNQWT
jgi:hypothetical protein